MRERTNDETALRERVYAPAGTRNVGRVFVDILREFPAAHALGYRFAQRTIKSRYRQSFLGILWAFLPPLATALVWIVLYKSEVINLKDVGVPYPVFVVTGTLLWSIFSVALLTPLQVVQQNRSILVKINFPREALLVNAFYEVLFSAIVVSVIVGLELLVFQVRPGSGALLFVPSVFILAFLGMSLGLLLLPITLLLKDIQFLLPSVLQFAMYLTPVVYAKPVYVGAAHILAYNPVTPVLTNARTWLLGTGVECPMWQYGAVACVALLLLLIGIVVYRISMGYIIERMGS